MKWLDNIRAILGMTATSSVDGIMNFRSVIEGKLYRGGQPSRDGWLLLASLGVKTIIKLNYPDEGQDDAPGFKIIACSMPPKDFWQAIGTPGLAACVAAARAAIDALARDEVVYLHCLHGQDRTGLISGMIRVMFCGWTCEAAYAEMLKFGYHPELHDLHETWEAFVESRGKGV